MPYGLENGHNIPISSIHQRIYLFDCLNIRSCQEHILMMYICCLILTQIKLN